MASSGIFAPAHRWRAFFVCAMLAGAAWAAQPAAAPPPLAQVGKPDAAEAARILEQFRNSGLPGQYFLQFELHELPRRGEETVFQGRIWGGRTEQGAVLRITLTDADGRERRVLLQNGEKPSAWRLENGRPVPLAPGALFEPVIPGVQVTAFDLQMPFLYWPGAEVESIQRVRGRPAYAFIFRAPAAFAAAQPQFGWVRSFFDTQFNAPLQTETFGRNGAPLKTLALVDLKKIGEQWMVKSLDVRDEVTRDKTRMLVTGAALNLPPTPALFVPGALADDVAPPAKIVPVGP